MKTFAIIFCGIIAIISAIVILKLSQKKKPRAKPKKTKIPQTPILERPKPHARQVEINALAKHNPEMVGHILKQWLNEESKKNEQRPKKK
jgi:flagellar biosynthesis/type III secretory pathway M-ring protein FliF/YscJ